MQDSICCILNYAPHYRQAIYKLMEDELNCDFYFGDSIHANIKKIDYRNLSNVKELKSVWVFNRFYWIIGSVKLLFKSYNKYLLTCQINCISDWIIILLSKLLRKEIYYWNHGWYGKETRAQASVKKLFFSYIKGFFLYGEYSRNLMIQHGIEEKKLHVIYNSLDYEQTLKVRATLAKSDI